MGAKLNQNDATAVDMVLDRMQVGGDGGTLAFAAPVGEAVTERIGAVESVLRILSEVPVEEPPQNLAARTLARVSQLGRPMLSNVARVHPQAQQPHS